MMTAKCQNLIIGSGVASKYLAWALAKQGREVLVVDRLGRGIVPEYPQNYPPVTEYRVNVSCLTTERVTMFGTTQPTAPTTPRLGVLTGSIPWLWQTVGGGYALRPQSRFWEGSGRIGEVLRQALLLNSLPVSLPNLLLAVTYAPAFADQAPVGGDFFDAFALPGKQGEAGEIALLVGDMAGKGLEAAVHIAAVKYALRAYLREPSPGFADPATALFRLNEFICHAQELDGWNPDALVSLALVILNTTTGIGRFALAAAEAPLVLNPQSSGAESVAPLFGDIHGLPLGMRSSHTYDCASFDLPPGATLLMLTDGLTEARHPERTASGRVELLGYDGIAALAGTDGVREPLFEMGLALLEHVRANAGGHLRDDACLLLARRSSIPPSSDCR